MGMFHHELLFVLPELLLVLMKSKLYTNLIFNGLRHFTADFESRLSEL